MPILHRQLAEQQEQQLLAPYAIRAGESRGRRFPEAEHPYRTCFQRDKDRIIHSNAFRRLMYKTQVFVNFEGDHYRTRLTHTIEVAQTALTMARALRLNADLTETIALAHDLGHTPFGHAGETALNELMKDDGGFEHNRQSLRVVDELEERYPRFPGLNLSFEVREGIIKHHSAYDSPEDTEINPGKLCPLEGQIVNLADEIAYNCHDLEDGLRSQIIIPQDIAALDLWGEALDLAQGEGPFDNEEQKYHQAIRHLKNMLVSDAVTHCCKLIDEAALTSADDVRNYTHNIIALSPARAEQNKELRTFLFHNLYFHFRIVRMADKAAFFINRLFKRYLDRPQILPNKIQQKLAAASNKTKIIADYIAGMTDRYALNEYEKLFYPYERV